MRSGRPRAALAAVIGEIALLLAFAQAPSSAAVPLQTVAVHTLPPVAGAVISVGGYGYRTDSEGNALVDLPVLPTGASARQITAGVDVRHPRDRAGKRVRFDHWSGGYSGLTARFDVYHRVKPRFTGEDGERIRPGRVDSIELTSAEGRSRTVTSPRSFWLHSSQVVPHPGGASKRIPWSIEAVMVDGSNVVNRAQQRFFPATDPRPAIPLLFYSTTITASDALLGFPIGSSIELSAPDGTKSRWELGSGAKVELPPLPRGDYEIRVDGPGISFSRPLTVSRDQSVTLSVISVLDIVIAIVVLGAIALSLLLARRPALRSRLRRPGSHVPARLQAAPEELGGKRR